MYTAGFFTIDDMRCIAGRYGRVYGARQAGPMEPSEHNQAYKLTMLDLRTTIDHGVTWRALKCQVTSQYHNNHLAPTPDLLKGSLKPAQPGLAGRAATSLAVSQCFEAIKAKQKKKKKKKNCRPTEVTFML